MLLRVGRALAEARRSEDVQTALCDAAVNHDGAACAAAAVLQVSEDGQIRMTAPRALPSLLHAWHTELETVGPELGEGLRSAWGRLDPEALIRTVRTLPLVSGGNVFGALVLFGQPGAGIDAESVSLAEGLADMAAVALDKATQHEALLRSYAELRASREILARSEKLRALGEMAAGISHDIKNILNPLSLQLELLRRRIHKGPDAALQVVVRMEDAIRSGVEVVERLRTFSRQEPECEAEPVNLSDAISSAVELCRPRLHVQPGLALTLEMLETPQVLARRADLITAVVNLVFNAVEAIAGPGIIVVRTGPANGGGFVQVEDNGPGMTPEMQKRVFEPFFTTKEQGTGMGLAMVYAFVQRHGGSINVDTETGRGTKFRLWFPAAPAPKAS